MSRQTTAFQTTINSCCLVPIRRRRSAYAVGLIMTWRRKAKSWSGSGLKIRADCEPARLSCSWRGKDRGQRGTRRKPRPSYFTCPKWLCPGGTLPVTFASRSDRYYSNIDDETARTNALRLWKASSNVYARFTTSSSRGGPATPWVGVVTSFSRPSFG